MESPKVSSTDLIDESGRPFFEREVALEKSFLLIRAARASSEAMETLSDIAGAPVIFPVTLFGPFEKGSGCGPAGQRALDIDHEPGSIFPKGKTKVSWNVTIQGWTFRGDFIVAVGERAPKNSESCSMSNGRITLEIGSPFSSVSVKVLRGRPLKKALQEISSSVPDAQVKILGLSEGLLMRSLQRYSSRLVISSLDWDDLMQIAKMKTLDMADRYASSNRPSASWGRVVGLGVDKAIQRAINKDAGIGRPEEAVRRLFSNNPEMKDASVDEVRRALLPQISEASTWSDNRIAQAISGVPYISTLPADDILHRGSNSIMDANEVSSMVEMLSDLIPNIEDRRTVAPFLIVEGLVNGDPSMYTNTQVGKAKKALFEIIKGRIEDGEGSGYQLLLGAFSEQNESLSHSSSKRKG